jgi:hypothetical protein
MLAVRLVSVSSLDGKSPSSKRPDTTRWILTKKQKTTRTTRIPTVLARNQAV